MTKAHPAQADNLAREQAQQMLQASAAMLLWVRAQLWKKEAGPATRAKLRRQLSGVLSDVEVVRIAIQE